MSILRVFYLLGLLTFSFIAVVQAAGDRDLIIQKQLDCVDQHLPQKDGVSWNDVCDVPDNLYQEPVENVSQQTAPAVTVQAPTQKPVWNFEIVPEASYIKYTEYDSGSTFVRETGSMYGVNGSISYHPPQGNALNTEITDMYRLEAMATFGTMTYHGGYENGSGGITPYTQSGLHDAMTEERAIAGKDFDFDNHMGQFTPYIGFGYRSLFDDAEVLPGGYNRLIQYLYIPVGGDISIPLSNGWSLKSTAEYDIFIRGFVSSTSGVNAFGDLQNNQDNGGYGVRGSINFVKNCGNFNLFFGPYIRYWNINVSRVDVSTPLNGYVLEGDEPANTSIEFGGKLGIDF